MTALLPTAQLPAAQLIAQIERHALPIEVDSAFGGLGIYKISSVLKNQRTFTGYKRKLLPTARGRFEVGWQMCEHISFNAGFREIGERLFILPYLVNAPTRELTHSPEAFRDFIFDLASLPLAP